MGRLVFKYLIFLLFIIIYSCNRKNEEKIIQTCNNCSIIDSLQNVNYDITNKINYFDLSAYSSKFSCKDIGSLFAIKKNKQTVSILEFSCNNIYKNRLIEKYSNKYYIEKQIFDNTDGGEKKYFTIYYSSERIVIIVVNEDIFIDKPMRFYLKDVFIVDGNLVTKYDYSNSADLHLKDGNVFLSEKELGMLNEDNVKKLFFNKENVKKYQYINDNFAEKDTYIYQLFLLSESGSKASDFFNS